MHGGSCNVPCHLILKVTHCHCSLIVFVRSQSLSAAHIQGKGNLCPPLEGKNIKSSWIYLKTIIPGVFLIFGLTESLSFTLGYFWASMFTPAAWWGSKWNVTLSVDSPISFLSSQAHEKSQSVKKREGNLKWSQRYRVWIESSISFVPAAALKFNICDSSQARDAAMFSAASPQHCHKYNTEIMLSTHWLSPYDLLLKG